MRGGCDGVLGKDASAANDAGAGGGAVWIASDATLTLGDSAVINASGAGGLGGAIGHGGSGGGSGGTIVLQAPTITSTPNVSIFANGGGGGGGGGMSGGGGSTPQAGSPGIDPVVPLLPGPAGMGGAGDNTGGSGGQGYPAATVGLPPTANPGLSSNGGSGGGGGGGGAGVIRIQAGNPQLPGQFSPQPIVAN